MTESTENRVSFPSSFASPCQNDLDEAKTNADTSPVSKDEAENDETAKESTTSPVSAVEKSDAEKKAEDEKKRAEDEKKRAEHEAAEAQRKAEWEEKQRKKKEAREAKLREIAALSSSELQVNAIKQTGDQTEQFVQRNMKVCVTEVIQQKCVEDPTFARLVLNPDKCMIHCFSYIKRKAFDYLKDLAQQNEKAGFKDTDVCGDVPDGLCYQWAIAYFQDMEAQEDKKDEEEFIPRPYHSPYTKAKKSTKSEKKKPAPLPPSKIQAAEKTEAATQVQISFDSLSA